MLLQLWRCYLRFSGYVNFVELSCWLAIVGTTCSCGYMRIAPLRCRGSVLVVGCAVGGLVRINACGLTLITPRATPNMDGQSKNCEKPYFYSSGVIDLFLDEDFLGIIHLPPCPGHWH